MQATFPKSFAKGLTGLATPATGGRLAVSGNEQSLGGQEAVWAAPRSPHSLTPAGQGCWDTSAFWLLAWSFDAQTLMYGV